MSVLQVAVGRRTGHALSFWREYVRVLEKDMDFRFDHTLFEFYQKAEVITHVGLIRAEKGPWKPTFDKFPWGIPFSTLLGVVTPWVLATLWMFDIVARLYNNAYTCAAALVSLFYLALFTASWIWVPGKPEVKS